MQLKFFRSVLGKWTRRISELLFFFSSLNFRVLIFVELKDFYDDSNEKSVPRRAIERSSKISGAAID